MAGPPVDYSVPYRMSLVLHPQFKFPDNTFILKMICNVRTYSQVKKLPIVCYIRSILDRKLRSYCRGRESN